MNEKTGLYCSLSSIKIDYCENMQAFQVKALVLTVAVVRCRGLREARDMAYVEKDRAMQTERDALGKYEQLMQE